MAENREKIEAVRRMQAYMTAHFQEDVTLRDLASAALYSPWHASRAFSDVTGKTPFEYLRMVRLSAAAKKLRDTDMRVLDIALESAFGTHEGFTKAFSRMFAASPRSYRKEARSVRLFSCDARRRTNDERSAQNMTGTVIFTQVIERPKRKLILKRGIEADEYMAYCREVGCAVWDVLEAVGGALYEPVGLWLPEDMRKPGTSEYCQGVEVPADFAGEIPEGFEIMDLPACRYMVFQSEPFDDEDFGEAISFVWDAIARYDPKLFGWAWAPEDGPRFQLAPVGARGYIEGLPVRNAPRAI